MDFQHDKDMESSKNYQATIISSPVCMGRFMGDCVSFIGKNTDVLQIIPTAFFGVGLTMKEDTKVNREKMADIFAPAVETLQPSWIEYFPGRIQLENLPFLYRLLA